jgi:carboxyl-terminal processing protease
MMPGSNNGVGMNTGFPDVCQTPPPPPIGPYPIPYPNLSMNAQAAAFSPNVFTGFMPSLFMASVSPMTSGDEAGCLNPLFKQAGGYTMGNPIVFVNCQPATNLLCPSWGNAMNCPVGASTVPSVTTTLYTDRALLNLASPEVADTAVRHERTEASGPPVDAAAVHRLRGAVEHRGADDPPVEAETLADGIRVVRIRRFTEDVGTRWFNAVRCCDAQSPILVDLRGNPGGDADAALGLAGEFLERGTPVALVQEGGDTLDDSHTVRARHHRPYRHPLVVLVDAATASAAELFAAALQDNCRAVIVGCRTAGKATAQRLLSQPTAPELRYATVACFRRPSGTTWHGQGIEPDVAVPAPEDGFAEACATATRLARR